jgi:hypothetical protein
MDMEDFMGSRGFGGLFAGGIDYIAVFLFVAIAVLYFLAPVLGYRPERRGTLAASLYLLVGYAGASLIQMLIVYLQVLSRSSRGDATGHIFFLFAILKLILFIVAMILFAVGLQALRPRAGSPAEERRGPPPGGPEHAVWPEHR